MKSVFLQVLHGYSLLDDETRVKLFKGSYDYINANYVNVSIASLLSIL